MLKSGFYNSSGGDRKYDATDFAEIFDSIMDDGVIRGFGTEFALLATTGLNFTVGPGHSWFNETYLNNTDLYPLALGASEVAQNRIDTVVLEFDSSDSIRANTIKIVKGDPGSVPVAKTLIPTETLHQYPVGYIYRAAGSTSITQANITKAVGTPACPYAVSKLLDRSFEPSIMHRQTFRGKNLGTAYTAAQKAAIQNGSFDDLYIGDYWLINGQKWRIADIDYYYNKGTVATTAIPNDARIKHHLVIMPDNVLTTGKMNESVDKQNAGGYLSTDARGTHFTTFTNLINSAFGAANKMLWSSIVTFGVNNGKPNNVKFINCSVEIPNMNMFYGQPGFYPDYIDGVTPASLQTESVSQLALFKLAPWLIVPTDANGKPTGETTWTRDLVSGYFWAVVGRQGEATYVYSHLAYGFRPYFLLGA